MKCRWVCAATTLAMWAGWLYVTWQTRTHECGPVVWVAKDVLMLAAGLSSIVLILGILVSPVLTTAAVWRELGMQERGRQCTCRTLLPTNDAATVIRLRPVRANARSDN